MLANWRALSRSSGVSIPGAGGALVSVVIILCPACSTLNCSSFSWFSRALDGLAYPRADDANATGARLQQTLRGFAEEAGLTVVGSQLAVSAAQDIDDQEKEVGLFDQLAVELSLDGPPIALDAFLVAVSQHSPALATVSIDIQRKRRSRRDDDETRDFLTVRLRVVALRVTA